MIIIVVYIITHIVGCCSASGCHAITVALHGCYHGADCWANSINSCMVRHLHTLINVLCGLISSFPKMHCLNNITTAHKTSLNHQLSMMCPAVVCRNDMYRWM